MAAFASPIHKAGGLKIGYQFSDFWRHAWASVVSSYNGGAQRPGSEQREPPVR